MHAHWSIFNQLHAYTRLDRHARVHTSSAPPPPPPSASSPTRWLLAYGWSVYYHNTTEPRSPPPLPPPPPPSSPTSTHTDTPHPHTQRYVGSDATRESPRDGELNLDCVLRSGNAQRARLGRSSAGARAAAAASKGTRNRTSTSTSGHRLRLGRSRVDVPLEIPVERRLALATNRRDRPKLLRWPGSSWHRQKASAMPEECIRMLENEVQKEEAEMKQAQPFGQKMDQARARFRRAVDSGEKAMEALQKAQVNFEQAQQEVMQAQTDLEMLMQEAPLPVMPVPQVSVSLVRTLEAWTSIIENMWNPDAGPPPDHLVHTQSGSRGKSSKPLRFSSLRRLAQPWTPSSTQDRIPSCGIWKTKPRRWQTSRRRTLQAGRRSKQRCRGHARLRRGTHRSHRRRRRRASRRQRMRRVEPSPRRPKGYQHELW